MEDTDSGTIEEENRDESDSADKRKKLKWYQVVTHIGCGTLVFFFGLTILVGIVEDCRESKKREKKFVHFKTMVVKIGTDYNSNPIGAERKYKGKKVVVSGLIKEIGLKGPSFWQSPYLTLSGGAGVICRFPVGHGSISGFYELSKGQWVTVKGKVGKAKDGVVIIESCVFVNSTG